MAKKSEEVSKVGNAQFTLPNIKVHV
ncbi:hypothetical protein LCGC14_2548510, partial [marine sediment metagenome]